MRAGSSKAEHRSEAGLVGSANSEVVGSSPTPPSMKYIHGPHLGDTIYGLPTIRQLGGGDLYLYYPDEENRIRFSGSFEYFESLPYIGKCYLIDDKEKAGPDAIDLDRFREHDIINQTIVKAHFDAFNISTTLFPWLTARSLTREYPVLVHWTDRQRSLPLEAWDFLRDIPNLYCLGYPHEVPPLIERGAIWVPTSNMHELASAVKASYVFIGNQSSPLALAVGMGKRRLFERSHDYDNCFFGSKNERVLTSDSRENKRLFEELMVG
jgi:hypothetical protein